MGNKEEINAKEDYLNTIESWKEAFKDYGVPSTPIWIPPPYRETKQDKIDWLYLIHCEEYDNHPLIRFIDTLIIILGCFLDLLSNIGNKFIERNIRKKYVVKWLPYNKLSKRKRKKLALGRLGL